MTSAMTVGIRRLAGVLGRRFLFVNGRILMVNDFTRFVSSAVVLDMFFSLARLHIDLPNSVLFWGVFGFATLFL